MKFKGLKKAIVCTMVSVLAFTAVTGCSKSGGTEPDQVLSSTLDAVKVMDQEAVAKGFSEDKTDAMGLNTDDSSKEEKEMLKLFFDKLSYKIVDTKVEGDNATIKAEITNIDFTKAMGNYFTKVLEVSMSNATAKEGEQLSDEALQKKTEELLVEMLSASDVEMITKEVAVQMTKVDGSWKIETSDELLDAITGGMMSLGAQMGGLN